MKIKDTIGRLKEKECNIKHKTISSEYACIICNYNQTINFPVEVDEERIYKIVEKHNHPKRDRHKDIIKEMKKKNPDCFVGKCIECDVLAKALSKAIKNGKIVKVKESER